MSLDVYLDLAPREVDCTCSACGHQHRVVDSEEVFSANITHNLTAMATAAGIYWHLWRPEEIDITRDGDLVEALRCGLDQMRADPERFKALDASNGYGRYVDFVPWLERYIEACEENPEARVRISR